MGLGIPFQQGHLQEVGPSRVPQDLNLDIIRLLLRLLCQALHLQLAWRRLKVALNSHPQARLQQLGLLHAVLRLMHHHCLHRVAVS